MRTLTDAAWVLAALVTTLGDGVRSLYSVEDPAARVLAAAGFFQHEGNGLLPAPGITKLMANSGTATIELARSVLGQVAAVANGGGLDEGWKNQDDETLLAQGAASGRFVPMMFGLLFERLPEIEERLRAPGARFLDVGVGVGGMACALAEVIPSLSLVGIDPFERALRLAGQNVAAHGLEERVTLRACGVEDLDDDDGFDLAFLPAPFIPSGAFSSGLTRLHRALRPGGWILLGMARLQGDGVSGEVTRWQTQLIGGTPLTPDEAEMNLVQAGFADVVILDTPPGAPAAVAARRPV